MTIQFLDLKRTVDPFQMLLPLFFASSIRRSSHPSDVREIELRCNSLEISVIEAQDTTFKLAVLEEVDVQPPRFCPTTRGDPDT